MNTQEAFQLLTLASARDGRTVDLAVATVWADDLAGVPLHEAAAAVRAHYLESTDWVMPAHIVQRIRRERQLALPQTMSEEVPDCTPGRHRRMPDGTCLFCTHREYPDE